MKRDYRLYIEDILDCVLKIQQFTSGMENEEFVTDEKTNTAVIHKLEIMGEATKNVPGDVKARYKDVPWSDNARPAYPTGESVEDGSRQEAIRKGTDVPVGRVDTRSR